MIQQQDIVVNKSDQSWEDANDKIAIVRTDDGLTIKKVQIDHQRQQIILQPFNIDYPVLVLNSDWNYGAFLIGTIALQLRFYLFAKIKSSTAPSKACPNAPLICS
ncbi:hypothetical protein MASR1M36_17490 [Candidatus Cloacimonadaceae bacterium]